MCRSSDLRPLVGKHELEQMVARMLCSRYVGNEGLLYFHISTYR
jgi:hypothetical protein